MSDVLPADEDLTPVDAMPADDELEPIPADEDLTPISEEPVAPNEYLKLAFRLGVSKPPEEQAKQVATSRKMSVPLRLVDADPGGWYDVQRQVEFDENGWAKENPDLAKVASENPALAPLIVTSKELGPLTKAWNATLRFLYTPTKPTEFGDETTKAAYEAAAKKVAALEALGDSIGPLDAYELGVLKNKLSNARSFGKSPLPEKEALAKYEADTAEVEAAMLKLEAPKQATEVDDAKARVLREDESFGARAAIFAARYQEGQLNVDLSKASFDQMVTRARGGDTSEVDARIEELEKNVTPRAYGEGEVGQFFSTAATGLPSTIDVLKKTGVAGVAGAALGAIIGGAATKTPAGAAQGARTGMKAALWGGATGSFQLEAGSFYREAGAIKTDAGEALSEDERAGAAVVVGMLNAGIEVLELKALARVAGPASTLLEAGGKEKLMALLAHDSRFRTIVAKAAVGLGRSTAEEGVEGGAQEAVGEALTYLIKTVHDGVAQRGDVFSGRKILEAVEAEAAGAFVSGGAVATGSVVVQTSLAAQGTNKSTMAEKQPKALLELAQDPAVQAAPEVFAQMVREATAKSGEEVTALHIKGEGLRRYFQSHTEEDAERELVAALGPEAPAKLAEAVATGGSIEVPIAQAFSPAFAASELAKAVLPDIATQPGLLTPRELAEGGAEQIEQQARKIAEAELSRIAEREAFNRETDALKQQLLKAGRTKRQANTEVAVLTHFYETQAKVLGVKPEELVEQYRVKIGIGDEAPAETGGQTRNQGDANEALARRVSEAKPEARAFDLFRDPITGLRNRRSFDETNTGPVAILTTPDIKALNDDPNGGHDKANDLLRLIGSIVAQIDPDAARSGTNFLLPKADLSTALERVQAGLPDGLRAIGAVGENVDEAFANLDATSDTARKAGTLPPRGQTAFDLSKLPETEFKADLANVPFSEAELASVGALSDEQFTRATYFDKDVDGVLSKTGFDSTPTKKHVLALDLKGLKRINDDYSKSIGDLVLEKFAEVAMAVGGSQVYFAHLSGDEYAAKSDNPALLKAFTAQLQAALRKAVVPVTLGGQVIPITPEFRSGIGAKTYGAADRALNAAKRLEKERSAGGVGETRETQEGDVRRPGGLSGEVPGDEVRAEVRRTDGVSEAPGARDDADTRRSASDADENQPGVIDDSFDPAEIEADAQMAAQLLAGAEKFVSAIRLPEKKAYAEAWLAFCIDPSGERPAATDYSVEIEEALAKFGFVPPEGLAKDAETGRRLDVVRKWSKKTQAQPEELREQRNAGAGDTSLLPNMGKKRLNQSEAEKAGFHSPNAFGRPGTPEHAVAEDMLEELGAKPTEQVTNEEIRRVWTREVLRNRGLNDPLKAVENAQMEAIKKHQEKSNTRSNIDAGLSTEPFGAPGEVMFASGGENLAWPSEPNSGPGEDRMRATEEKYWKQIEKAVRLALEGDRTLLYSLDPKNPTGAPRGYTELPSDPLSKVFSVMLNKNADASTVIHESAHVFLEILKDLAEKPDAPERVRGHYADALAALGVKEGEKLETEHHEKFARGFEAYLFEGKSPTPLLEKLFVRFSLWLRNVYRTVRSLNVELTPELRSVFDRLLATDEEIERAKARHGPEMFATAKDAGMSDEEWLTQKQAEGEILEAETKRAQLYALKDRQRETERWWKDELAKQTEVFEAAYEALPARKAQKILTGEEVDGVKVGPFVLDRARVEATIGKLKVPGLKTSTEPSEVTNADDVALLAGFPTAEGMLAALAGLRPKERWVEEQARAKMAELHPDVLEDRTRLKALIENGLDRYTSTRILREFADLGRRAGVDVSGIAEAVKLAAKRIVEERRFGELNAAAALASERAAANAKAKAAAKGDWGSALEFGRRQLMNAALHRELLKAREERDSIVELAREMSDSKSRARLGKASPIYRDAADFILEAFEFKARPEREVELDAGIIDQAITTLESDAMTVGSWRDTIKPLLAKDSADLTLGDARLIADALKNIRAAARQRNTVIVDEARAEKTFVIEQLVKEFASTLPKQSPPGTAESAPFLEKVGRKLKGADGLMLTIPRMAAHLTDNDLKSMTYRALIEPMRKAKAVEADLYNDAIKPIIEAFDAIPSAVRSRLTEAIDGAKLFPNHTSIFLPPRERFELLMMALNVGNEGNLQRLLDGRNISEAQMKAALDLLTREELDWVQSIFDSAEKLRPLAFDLEERDSGIRPEAVVATPRVFKNGSLRGGYFPAIYERSASQVGERQAAQQLDQFFDQSYTRGTTPHGHLKARADKVVAVISLSPKRIASNIAQVAHDIAFREAVKSVGGLILSPEVDTALKEHLGPERARQFLQWVKDIGTMSNANDPGVNEFASLGQYVKSNLAPAVLGFNKAIALGDFANLAAAVRSTKLTAANLSMAMLEFGSAPVQTRALAMEKSGQLRAMQDDFKRAFSSQLKTLTLSGGAARRAFTKLKDNAFVLQEAVAYAVNTPIWVGAYRQALAAGETEEQAIRFADDVLLRTAPTHSPVELSGLMRDKGPFSAAVALFGYMNLAYNSFRDISQPLFQTKFKEARVGTKIKTVGAVAANTLAFSFAAFVLGDALMGKGPEAGDDDEDDPGNMKKRYANWLKRKLLLGPIHTIPLPIGTVAESTWLGRPTTNVRTAPLLALFETLGKAIAKVRNENVETPDKILAILKSIALLLGAPLNPVTTTGKYLFDVGTDKLEVPNAGRAIGGVIYGERDKQPDNIPQAIGDALSEP